MFIYQKCITLSQKVMHFCNTKRSKNTAFLYKQISITPLQCHLHCSHLLHSLTVFLLELRDISKRFGSVQANDHVNLTLRKSEILAILGENGSGKTTLMNMIYGIYYPDEGHIFVNGKEVKIRSPKDSYFSFFVSS